ncbi:hypothetical protein G6F56_006625 [Rhizopus delemar]|uniref:Uncharacterized protein n=1 Tax=Rhizopus stolonifer TaxID=4846 RepID=A0A367KTC2_RHIST|nr:hypothetical protein G6F56_006625 [Rhizopus delemar]RCI05445.1 hypothetical protein CU098_012852 [Rhizopus stolonifer]
MTWTKTLFSQALKLKYPIVQAPCAGHTGVELIAAASNAGGLGSLGAGIMPANQLRKTIQDIRLKTQQPFAVNLFCRPTPDPTQEELQRHYDTDDVLDEIRTELKIPIPEKFELRSPPLEDQVKVLLDEGVPVVSFTFGLLPDSILMRLWNAGTFLIGTATTKREALVLAGLDPSDPTRKADAILLQGLEAGGHRGSFLISDSQEGQLPIRELIKEVKEALGNLQIPVIAAGGLSTGEDVVDVLKQGADGAALGTLFMLAKESITPRAHREHMLNAKQVDTPQLTQALTGRWARGFPNELMKRLETQTSIPCYDIHSSKTKDIAAFCTQQGISDYMLLLSGQNVAKAVEYSDQGTLSVSEIVDKIAADVGAKL